MTTVVLLLGEIQPSDLTAVLTVATPFSEGTHRSLVPVSTDRCETVRVSGSRHRVECVNCKEVPPFHRTVAVAL